MSKLWSTNDLLGWEVRDLLVWHNMLNNCSFKSLIILPKRGIIPRNIIKVIKITPRVACLFVKSHKRYWRTKGKHSGGLIGKPSETRPGAMT